MGGGRKGGVHLAAIDVRGLKKNGGGHCVSWGINRRNCHAKNRGCEIKFERSGGGGKCQGNSLDFESRVSGQGLILRGIQGKWEGKKEVKFSIN